MENHARNLGGNHFPSRCPARCLVLCHARLWLAGDLWGQRTQSPARLHTASGHLSKETLVSGTVIAPVQRFGFSLAVWQVCPSTRQWPTSHGLFAMVSSDKKAFGFHYYGLELGCVSSPPCRQEMFRNDNPWVRAWDKKSGKLVAFRDQQ